jgi:hypothetical protein
MLISLVKHRNLERWIEQLVCRLLRLKDKNRCSLVDVKNSMERWRKGVGNKGTVK